METYEADDHRREVSTEDFQEVPDTTSSSEVDQRGEVVSGKKRARKTVWDQLSGSFIQADA